jgi:hypothetical protein
MTPLQSVSWKTNHAMGQDAWKNNHERINNIHLDFPPGSKVKDARSHGASFWTRTARIDIELADKTQKAYFLRVSTGELGMSMLRGVCEGAKVIHKHTAEGIHHRDRIPIHPSTRPSSWT